MHPPIPPIMRAVALFAGLGASLLAANAGGAGGNGSSFSPPQVSAERLAAFAASLTDEQRGLLQQEAAARSSLPAYPPHATGQDWHDNLPWLSAMSPGDLAAYWRRLPADIDMERREGDPWYVTASERSAAAKLPARSAADARCVASPAADVAQARLRLIADGPSCRALLLDAGRGLPDAGPAQVRVLTLLHELESLAQDERAIADAEAAETTLASCRRARPQEFCAMLLDRMDTDWLDNRRFPLAEAAYCDVVNRVAGRADVELLYGQGTRAMVVDGGLLLDLGDVAGAPPASWEAALRLAGTRGSGQPLTARLHHRYAMTGEERSGLQAFATFEVMGVDDRWLVIACPCAP